MPDGDHIPSASPTTEGDAGVGPHGEARSDTDTQLQRARDLVWRALNRRDRTVGEMRAMLAGRDFEPAIVDAVVSEVLGAGYLDDARYALNFAEDRRRLDAWGRERIERRLGELGVGAEDIEAAVSVQDPGDELSSAIELLRRRFPTPPADDRERSRALGLLVRRGYDSECAYEAIRRHSAGG